MADKYLTELALLTDPALADAIYILDDLAGTPTSKYTTLTYLNALLQQNMTVINQSGADQDLRVEGDNNENLLYIDAGNDRVGIGTATPSVLFDVSGALAATTGAIPSLSVATTLTRTGKEVSGSAGNVVRNVFTKTGIADNSATAVFTVTTTNETGDTDGGAYTCFVRAIGVHNGSAAGDNAVMGGFYHFSRAQQAAGTGQLSAVVEAGETAAAESEGGTTRGIASVTMTVAETTEYITAANFTIDLDGSGVTTAVVVAEVTLVYYGYTTPPTLAAA